MRCGSAEHWVATCSLVSSEPKKTVTSADRCFRCDRTGHYASSCYAQTDAKGYALDEDEDDEDEEEEEDEEDEDEDDY
jgi:hypothetical protein